MSGQIKTFRKIILAISVGWIFLFSGLNLSWALDLDAATGTKATSTSWSGYANVNINSGVTVTFAAGTHDLGAANLIVNSGGTIICSSSSTTAAGATGVTIITTGNITVNSGGSINADATGYKGGKSWDGYGTPPYEAAYGPAPGINTYVYGGGGGGHGGVGGNGGSGSASQSIGGSPTYGSATSPVTLGSGGGGGGQNTAADWGVGGAGGGAIKLVVSGILTNNGIISANGGIGSNASATWRSFYGAGGGAGGSVWTISNVLAGTGAFQAKGGDRLGGDGYGVTYIPGGGGGGRIACYYATGTNSTTRTVTGGAGGSAAGVGTSSSNLGVPILLAQYQNDGTTLISTGGASTNQYAVFKFVMSSSAGATTLTPQVEVKPVGTGFDGLDASITSGTAVSYNGTNAVTGSVTYLGLKFNSPQNTYHWQARIKDAVGNVSAWISYGDNAESAADIQSALGTSIIANGTTLIADTTYTNLYVAPNITLAVNSLGKTGGAGNITLTTGNLWLDAGAVISANGKGYAGGTSGSSAATAGAGSGAGNHGSYGGGGASYAGAGGSGYSTNTTANGSTTIYGSATAPTDLGSGGGGSERPSTEPGGAGGGAIKLVVTGILTNNGIVSANGDNGGVCTPTGGGGGGSGGSIWVVTDSLKGSGSFSANGGNGEKVDATIDTRLGAGGGGGGRICLDPASSDTFTGSITVNAGRGKTGAVSGTIQRDPASTLEDITLTQNTTWTCGTYTFANLTINSGVTLTIGPGASGANSHNTNSPPGNGGGLGGGFSAPNDYGGGGAGHASAGGLSGRGASGGPAYNSDGLQVTQPTDLGSGGGGSYFAAGGTGGGAIKLNITGTMTNNGTISADGGNGAAYDSQGGGGGSGGSIWINTSTFSGAGTISAKGGNGGAGTDQEQSGGGGSGGRIACYYAVAGPTNAPVVTGGTAGGASCVAGGAGTTSTGTLAANNIPIIHLAQYQSDGTTGIGIGSASTNQYAVFKLVMSAATAQNLTPQVEVKLASVPFDETNITEGTAIAYTDTAVTGTVTYMGLAFHATTPVEYHWRARIKYADGTTFSGWTSFGNNADGVADIKGALGTNIVSNTTWTTDQDYSATNLYIASGVTVTVDSLGKTDGATLTTSTTSKAIAAGTGKTFTVGIGLATLSVGQTVIVKYDATNYMRGRITGYNSGTGLLTVDVYSVLGSGTYASWTVISPGQITLTVKNLFVAAGAAISADGKGEAGGDSDAGWDNRGGNIAATVGGGLGGCVYDATAAGGAGYGGIGGQGANAASGGVAYGSSTWMAPTDIGSGGGAAPSATGGSGGGAIKINATGILTNNGTISANGGNGIVFSNGRGSGGGSGGSIWVTVNTLDGSGVFSAKGGNGGTNSDPSRYAGGGGAGGRISLNPSYTDSYIGDITAEPGSGGQGGVGGTIYRAASLSPATVTLTKTTTTWSSGEHTFANLTIPLGITLSAGIGTGSTWSIVPRGQNGRVGFVGGGRSGGRYGSGAGYGGAGGAAGGGEFVGGVEYGSGAPEDYATSPVDFGSSGGGGGEGMAQYGGYGGGAIKLNITNTLNVSGVISASGDSGTGAVPTSNSYCSGGGSGGSIWFIADTVTGANGAILSNGGNGGNAGWEGGSGGGAGGRISAAVNHWNISNMDFSVDGGALGTSTNPANPGSAGADGTLSGIGPMTTISNPSTTATSYFNDSFTINGTATSPASTLSAVKILIKNITLTKYWNGSGWVDSASSWQDVSTSNVYANWTYPCPSSFTANTSYSYSITTQAFDGIFPLGGPVYSTANFVYDTVAPIISSVTLNPSTGYRKLGETVAITVNASGAEPNSGLLTPSTITFNGRSITLSAPSNAGPFTGTYTVTAGDANITNPSATGVTLTDSAGNVSSAASSAASTLIIDAYKPAVSVALSPSTGFLKISDMVTITATATHTATNLSGAALVLSASNATFNGKILTPSGSNPFTYTYTIAEGDTDVTNPEATAIVITDAAGNASDTGASTGSTLTIDANKPVVTDAHVSITTTPANGTAYLVGETVTARWDNSASGNNNSDIASATCDFSALGGGSTVAMTASSGVYTASYTISASSMSGVKTISVTATDTAGNPATTADTTAININNLALTTPGTLTASDSSTILWTGAPGQVVKLSYSLNGGTDNYPYVISAVTSGGSFSWTVPDVSSTTVKIKAELVSDGAYSATTNNFTISAPTITITSPNGAEAWYPWETKTITWTAPSAKITHVRLEYSTDGGLTYPNLIAAAAPNTGSYSWNLGNAAFAGQVKIKASGLIAAYQNLVIGGTAAAKVSTASASLDATGKILTIDVLNNFSAADTLTISGLQFSNFSVSGPLSLGIDIYNSGTAYANDDKTITISAPSAYAGGSGDGWAMAERGLAVF